MEHKSDRILQVCSRKWELGRHGAHACVHTCGGVFITSLLMALASCMYICGHKESSMFISHGLGEGSPGCARYEAIVGHLLLLALTMDFCLPNFDF